ncbi:hypothetical protein SUGI_0898790 [Cryptomeria japonica]|nr:hypothetical protein SUGI_0898790 [Cryptomeria japonica]
MGNALSSDHRLNDRKEKKKNAKWQAPPSGWLNLNFNGASRGNLSQSGLGAIIRNEDGEVVHAISVLVGLAINNVAEISALEARLRWCVNNGVVKLVIEGDSQVILNGVINSVFQSWWLQSWILRIKLLLNSLGDYRIQHMFREGNKATNYLANMGIEEDLARDFGRDNMMSIELKEIISFDFFTIPKSGIG